MRTVISFFEDALLYFSKAAVSIAAVVTLAVAVVGTVDVLSSRVFSRAVPGAFELSEAGLVLMVFLGLAIVTREDGHINVDLLVSRMGKRWQWNCAMVGLILTTVFLGLMTVQMGSLTIKSWRIKELATGLLPFPVYPVKIAALLGLTAATLESFRRLVKKAIGRTHSNNQDRA